MELASEKFATGKINAVLANEELLKHISPAGQMLLPELLDEKRVKHGIPDEAFRVQAVYDILYLVQLPSEGGANFFDGGILVRPDTKRSYDDKTNPKGVIVSAGLIALDNIRSHGMDLGHTVYFQRLSPFQLEYAFIGGLPYRFTVVTSGDITGSVDLMNNLREGKLDIEKDIDGRHVYKDLSSQTITERFDRERCE